MIFKERFIKQVIILNIVLCAIITSCSKSFNSSQELMTFLKDPANGYSLSKRGVNIQATLVFLPTDLMKSQQFRNEINRSSVGGLMPNYNDYFYFKLCQNSNNRDLLGYNDADNVSGNFQERLYSLSFALENNVNMVTSNNDTIKLLDYVTPRNYGLSPHTETLLVFPKSKEILESESLVVILKEIGTSHFMNFKFPVKKLINQPVLK